LHVKTHSEVIQYVDPFIGTGGHGHVFPGVSMPFGMVQLSPDTRTLGWDGCSGYHYSDTSVLGFSHTHLSGTGIGDYGDVLMMPFTGPAHIDAGNPEDPDSGYRSRFSHEDEVAYPGYYSVKLADYDILAELTASERVGFHRYTYPVGQQAGLIIDLSHTIHGHRNPVNEIRVLSDTEIEGIKQTQGWARRHYVYFYAKFSKPFTAGLYVDNKLVEGAREVNSQNSKAVLAFGDTTREPLLIKAGISAVDTAGARNNLTTEIPDWNFTRVQRNVEQAWKRQLSKVDLKGKDESQKTIFYTALYHTNMAPTIYQDADGRYRAMDLTIRTSETMSNYTVFSLWDTFRALHPLFTVLEPERDAAMIRSLVDKYEVGGILPKWDLASNYTGTMIGYHAVPVIVDAYVKGIRDFDIEKAYEACVYSASYDPDKNGDWIADDIYRTELMSVDKNYKNTIGYIPSDKENQSVAKGLEYAYDDWCIAQFAKGLGKTGDAEKFSEMAKYYKNYYDPESGFMRGRMSDGSWRAPFNPVASDHQHSDYCEGNAWQWLWFVPHDIQGLTELTGGKQKIIAKLDALFSADSTIEGQNASADITGLIGQYAHGNEPSHHIAHIYNVVGQPWKTQELVDTILTTLYFDNPNGLSGNEDCGQMSAWYVLNAMGFYSFCPGDPTYSIGRPMFDQIKLNLDNHKTFTITVRDNSKTNKYVQSAALNGKPLAKPFFSHEGLIRGGELIIVMGSRPNYQWGVN
jgi:predicted alpha-1,2-mannosidase